MQNLQKKIIGSSLLFVVALSTILVLGVVRAPRVAAAPFSCSSTFYQFIGGQLRTLDPETGHYLNVGPVHANMPNAAGYNVEDNYIYAMGGNSLQSHLLRFEHDGTYTDLGIPTGLPVAAYVSGDFDDSGNLWVGNFGALNTLYRIDVSTMTATPLALSNAMLVSELVFINGYLYAQQGPTSRQINISNGSVVSSTTTGFPDDIATSAAFGAGWTTSSGELYYSMNVSGVIWKIDGYDTGSPTATAIMNADVPTSNDGASCPLASSPLADPAAVDDTVTIHRRRLEVSANNGLLLNDVGEGIEITSYTQPAHGTVTVNPDGSYTYVADKGFTGTDTFTYTITDAFGQERTATVTIRVLGNSSVTDSRPDQLADTGIGAIPIIVTAIITLMGGLGLLYKAHRTRTY